MGRRVFVTGGGGFVGKRLLPALTAAGMEVAALDRSRRIAGPGIEAVQGDLLEPGTYREPLSRCDVVLHLAAATGRAGAADHHRINGRGTEILIEESRRAGVQKFLFVSSIATTFADVRGYHYAQAKQNAEAAVRASGLHFLILRPTMILGPGAPLLASLEKLAMLPVAVLPGNGQAQVQPIHVDDVVACLVTAVKDDAFADETIAIGGSERMSMEHLLRQLRKARKGVDGPLVRFPLPLLQIPLGLAETAGLGKLLPITAGQLSSFKFDGVGEANRLQPDLPFTASLDEMLQREAPAAAAIPRTPQPREELDAECRVFTRYLIGQEANDYVLEKYRAAHAIAAGLVSAGRADDLLVEFARRGPVFAKLADAHAALLAKASFLRKKLVLLLAILETCPPYYRTIDEPIGGGPAGAIARLAISGFVSVGSLLLGSLILVPLRMFAMVTPGGRH